MATQPPPELHGSDGMRELIKLVNWLRRQVGVSLASGTGVVQVTGGVVSALSLVPTEIVFGGPAGLIAQNAAFLISDLLNELQIGPAGFLALYGVTGSNYERARLYANGGQFVFQADVGGAGVKRALVLDFANIFANGQAGVVAADPAVVGVGTGRLFSDANITVSASLHELQILQAAYLANYNATGTDFERARFFADGTQHQLMSDAGGVGTRRRLKIDFPTVYVSHLSVGGIVYADVATGDLKLVTPGAGISFAGGTLSATGSGGTVTGVSATAPLFITGGASPTPNVTIQGAIVSGSTSTSAQNLGALTTGLLKGSVAAGVSTISAAAAGTDFQAPMSAADATVVFPTATTVRRAAITGDVTIAAASNTSALVNIPNDTVMAGDLLAFEIAAPSAPPGGEARIYVDSTSHNLSNKAASGVVNHGVRTQAGSSHQFVKSVADDGSSALGTPDALLETSGPTTLAVAAIPDSAPDSTSIIRPAGSPTLAGVATRLLQTAPTQRDLIYYDELTAGLITVIIGGNQWLATSGSGLLNANEVSYPLGKIVPNRAMIEAVVLGTNTFTAGKLVYTVMVNGSNAAFGGTGGTITIDSTSTAGTVVSSAVASYSGSPATTDRIGVLVSAGGTVPAVSATLRVAVTVRISSVAF